MHTGNTAVKQNHLTFKSLQLNAKSYSQNQKEKETGAREGLLLTVYHLCLLRGKRFSQS